MHNWKISEYLENTLKKLSKKDGNLHEQVMKKIDEIINSYDIEHYKNLRYNMKECKRVHIGHFVLVFRFDKKSNIIIFDDFDHHDKIYGR